MSALQATRPRMPAEWTLHERTIIAWPTDRPIWFGAVDAAREEYAAVARAIARFEPVLVVAHPDDAEGARRRCGSGVDVIALPIDDAWIRDNGPIIVVDSTGARTGLHFRFNAYGERFAPHEQDARVASNLLQHLGIRERRSDLVLEGGSIAVDGDGTLIATEQCLLHPNRNPGRTRAEIERELGDLFGVVTVVWLRWGRIEDVHTDGHVDVVCNFARPGVVIAQGCDDRSNPNYERLQANLRTLRSCVDARDRRLEIVELPMQPLVDVLGQPVLVSNVNFYVCNGGVIVPVADERSGDHVLPIFQDLFPEREVVGVRARMIGLGGGGIHCITQQIPVGT